jgi:hypothetical protein
MLAVIWRAAPMLCGTDSAVSIFLALTAASSACSTCDSNTTNSSPPWRLTVSELRTQVTRRSATD